MLSRDRLAVLAGFAAPLALTAILVPFRGSFANTDAALAMILIVVAVAAAGNRPAGYVAAVSAAVWFDFFLTRPYERFTINRAADVETTVLLLLIGIAVTEIAVWGRRQHAAASRRAGYLDGINDAARAVGRRRVPSALIDRLAGSLTQLLWLRSCEFQYGVAGIGRPARLDRDGIRRRPDGSWVSRHRGGAAGRERRPLQGRFLMQPDPGESPDAASSCWSPSRSPIRPAPPWPRSYPVPARSRPAARKQALGRLPPHQS